MRLIYTCFFLALCFPKKLFSQSLPKQLPAKRTTASIKIDGNIDEPAWKDVIPATHFIEFRPTFGAPEDSANRTEIFLLYDNTAVYVAGYCHERRRDSISTELAGRDQVGANDFVGVMFDTYYDKINGVGFYVTPLGEQFDAKYSNSENLEDDSWNAVWDSEAKLKSDGWTFEMRIPFSALRFSSRENQTWGLNITRRRQKTGQQYMWNPVDQKINGLINQEGAWTGIEKIKPTLRLSFSPYLSVYANHYPYNIQGQKNFTSSFNGGMDVKYGISQSFTLDMTLIPDFGQVQSDNQVLNLTPFEVRFNENRSFFTEGTELFSKGNLFYSRRVGGAPIHFDYPYTVLGVNERVLKNPTESKLINATKISGRTAKGFGLGVFNAITKPMYATIQDETTLEKRKIETNPLTNYNIVVFDQTMKNNSALSFINTNVMRSGHDYDANVSAALFDINNKKNSYNWNGKFAVSQIFNHNISGTKNINGYSHMLAFKKTGGNFNFQLTQELADNKYDINDMGIMDFNNFIQHYLWFGYKWVKPGKWYNQARVNLNNNFGQRFTPLTFQSYSTNVNANVQLKNLFWYGTFIGYSARGNDFYEPHATGRVYKSPKHIDLAVFMESNFVKKYSFGGELFTEFYKFYNGRRISLNYFHKYRFSDKFSLRQQLNFGPFSNSVGFYGIPSTEVLFARRDVNTVENELEAQYHFNNKSGISFRTRHYWSKVKNKQIFSLNTDGTLSENTTPMTVDHQNFNAFTIDAVYTLQFAPGSFINIVWKNSIYTNDQEIQYKYFQNLDRTVGSPQNNSLSFKILYYLDYVNFKKKK